MGVSAHYRDKAGEIGRKYGNILIGTLRTSYGSGFAKGCTDNEKLSEALPKLDDPLYLSWFATIKLACFL
jgi:hypothetical protein